MRTVQTPPRNPVLARQGVPALRRPQKPSAASQKARGIGAFVGYTAAFLAGYLPGLLAGRGAQSQLGQQLASYYGDTSHFSVWSQVFSAQMSAAFLQILAVVLCGFCVVGGALLLLAFAARGAFLGFCAASIAACHGVRTLALYWLLVCLPGLAVLFISLWLACHAAALSHGLFQSVFLGGAPRGHLSAAARRLLVRSGSALLLCGLFSVLGAGLDVLLAGLFL